MSGEKQEAIVERVLTQAEAMKDWDEPPSPAELAHLIVGALNEAGYL